MVHEIMDGHRPSVWLLDRYSAQQGHADRQQTCLPSARHPTQLRWVWPLARSAHLARDYRAIDKHSEAVDFLLTAKRDLDAAKRFFRKMLKDGPLLSPDRIGMDGAGTYPGGVSQGPWSAKTIRVANGGAIAAARKEDRLARDPVHHVTKHLQQGIESE